MWLARISHLQLPWSSEKFLKLEGEFGHILSILYELVFLSNLSVESGLHEGSKCHLRAWKSAFQSLFRSWKWQQVILCRCACCCSWQLHQKTLVCFIEIKSLFPSLLFLKRYQKAPQKNIGPQISYRPITWSQMVPWIFGMILLEILSGTMKVSITYNRQHVYRTYWVQ